MRLLLINYEMDSESPILAYQECVARKLAEKSEFVFVLTGKTGRYQQMQNMQVNLLPKKPFGVSRRVGGGLLLNPYVYQIIKRHRIDACFVHMAHDWVYELAPAFSISRIPTILWYAHRAMNWRARAAHFFARHVVTTNKNSVQMRFGNCTAIGHGIDADLFSVPDHMRNLMPGKLIYVGRISRIKNIEKVISVVHALVNFFPEIAWCCHLIGPELTPEDRLYGNELREKIRTLGLQEKIKLEGEMSQQRLLEYYRDASIHISCIGPGAMDKAILEALSAGCMVLVNNSSFLPVFGMNNKFYIPETSSAEEMAKRIFLLTSAPVSPNVCRSMVLGKYDAEAFVSSVLKIMKEKMQ